MTYSKFLPHIAKLLADPNEHVREQALSTIVEFYRVVGERLRTELARIDGVPQARMQALTERMDVMAHSGIVSVCFILVYIYIN